MSLLKGISTLFALFFQSVRLLSQICIIFSLDESY